MPSPTPTLHSADHSQGHKEPGESRRGSTHSDPSAKALAKQERHEHNAAKEAARAAAAPKGVSMQAPIEVSRFRFWMIFLALMFSIFLFALDQLIVATAIPKITNAFDSLSQLSWLASGFFLTLLGFNLMYSQWNQIFPSKVVMLFAIFIFEVGSLVCGVAPSMVVLILGRAIAGVGAAGIFSGGMIIIAELTPLHNRAQYFGLFGVCFAIASVAGPLVGGAFSDHVSWRWCFYINLPFGGIALAMIGFFQPLNPPMGRAASYKGFSRDMFWQVVQCDWVGVAIAMAWGCCLILFTEWGGVTRKWSDGGVIVTAVLTGVLIPVFLAWEYWLGDKAMFKIGLLKRRTIFGASFVLFNLFAVFMLEVYYISLAFQAVYNTSATMAGVRLLPFIMVQIVILIASSRIIPKIGRYKYIITAGPGFLILGSGLLYSIKYGMSINHLMGYQAFLGIGIGLSLQNSMLAVQHTVKSEPWLISAATGLAVFIGFAGRILGLSLAGSVFQNMLKNNLHKYAPGASEDIVVAVVNSADAVWKYVPDDLRPSVLVAYTETLRLVYILGLPFAVLGLLSGLLMKNSKMQSKEEEMAAIAAAKEKAAQANASGEKADALKAEEGAADAERAEEEAEIAEGTAAVAPLPALAGPGSDARVLVDKQEGRSPV